MFPVLLGISGSTKTMFNIFEVLGFGFWVLGFGFFQIYLLSISKLSTSFTSPACKSFKCTFPIRTRTNRKVGNPTAAVIFRTWRNFPSLTVMEAQDVGPWRSSLIFFPLAPKAGISFIIKESQGLLIYF